MANFENSTRINGVATQGRFAINFGASPSIFPGYVTKYCVIYHNGKGWFTTLDGGATWNTPFDPAVDIDNCYKFDGDEYAKDEAHKFD